MYKEHVNKLNTYLPSYEEKINELFIERLFEKILDPNIENLRNYCFDKKAYRTNVLNNWNISQKLKSFRCGKHGEWWEHLLPYINSVNDIFKEEEFLDNQFENESFIQTLKMFSDNERYFERINKEFLEKENDLYPKIISLNLE